jgi:hypothetical protein
MKWLFESRLLLFAHLNFSSDTRFEKRTIADDGRVLDWEKREGRTGQVVVRRLLPFAG